MVHRDKLQLTRPYWGNNIRCMYMIQYQKSVDQACLFDAISLQTQQFEDAAPSSSFDNHHLLEMIKTGFNGIEVLL